MPPRYPDNEIGRPAEVEWTQSGAPRSARHEDSYYSEQNGAAETEHVFIRGSDLAERFASASLFSIGELGFGTGLNFISAWACWKRNAPPGARLRYTAVEARPMRRADMEQSLSQWPELSAYARDLLARYEPSPPGFHRFDFPEANLALTLLIGDAAAVLRQLEGRIDAWFLDGFAPSRNPDMWSEAVMAQIARLSAPRATAATYSVAGSVRRGLSAVGFAVEKRPGFANKRECLFAQRPETPSPRAETPPSPRAPWFRTRPHGPLRTKARVAVIGAGIAGICVAHQLQQAGYDPIVFDKAERMGAGASGNPIALISPRLSLDGGPASTFYAQSFLYALRYYRQFAPDALTGHDGGLQLALDAAGEKRMRRLAEQAALPDDHLAFLTPHEVSDQAGVPLSHPGLFIRHLTTLRPERLFRELSASLYIRRSIEIDHLERTDDGWSLWSRGEPMDRAENVVLANAGDAARIHDQAYLSLSGSLGQLTLAPANASSRGLKSVLSWGPYLSPAIDDTHALGATYDPHDLNQPFSETPARNTQNFEALDHIAPGLFTPETRTQATGRASLRAVTPDRHPIVGAAINAELYKTAYEGLRQGRRRDYPDPPVSCGADQHAQGGLFVLTGLGSRGFCTAPLLAAQLVSELTGEPAPLQSEAGEMLHPARFLIRNLKRNLPRSS